MDLDKIFQWSYRSLKRYHDKYVKAPYNTLLSNVATIRTALNNEKAERENNEESLNLRLSIVEELADISIEGGSIGIATANDFINRTPEGDAKIPTVAAVTGILITNQEMDNILEGDVAVYLTDVQGNAVLDENGKPIEII